MNPLHIVVLDRDTLVNRPFDFDFPHTLSSYGTTEAHETLERIRGADIVITNKVVISAQAFAENPQLKLVAVTATGVNNVVVCGVSGQLSDTTSAERMASSKET